MRVAAVSALTVPVVLATDALLSPAHARLSTFAVLMVVASVVAAVAATDRLARGVLTAGPRTLASATAVAGQIAGHAVITLATAVTGTGAAGVAGTTWGGCLPAVGRGADLGLRLALLRSDATCPPGTLAPGITATAATLTLVTAVVVVLAHALSAVVTSAAVTAAAASLRAARLLSSLVRAAPPVDTGTLTTPPRRRLAVRVDHSWTPRVDVPSGAGRRGPPELSPA